jgi:hypothetical protein
MDKKIYMNLDERFGERQLMSPRDYQKASPFSIFHFNEDEIAELRGNDWVVVGKVNP